jgi:hypothetical protein
VPKGCSICDLDQKPRKIGEALIREGLGVFAVTDFSNWWLEKNTVVEAGEKAPTVTKSSWDRHKAHFVLEDKKQPFVDSGQYTTVEGIAMEMVRRFGAQLSDPNYLPAGRDVREWAALMGKLNDLEERRRDEEKLRSLMAGAVFAQPALPAAIRVTEPE